MLKSGENVGNRIFPFVAGNRIFRWGRSEAGMCDWCITALNHCLNNDARLIFIFRENIGLPYRQIGEIMEWKESNVRQVYNRSIQKITAFMNDTCPLYNPDGACKCRICKPVYSIDMDKEYAMVQRMMRLADLYRKFEKELPRKNYWEKFLQ